MQKNTIQNFNIQDDFTEGRSLEFDLIPLR
jgi:hypothetical protein